MIANFTVNPFYQAQKWVAYTLSDMNGAVQYVGYCKASQLFTFTDARSYSLFEQVFGLHKQATLSILGFTDKVYQVQNLRANYISEHGFPFVNKKSKPVDGRIVAIYCVETNEQFSSMSEACETHGISSSSMSNHLKRKIGYKTCKGKTYRLGYIPFAVRSDESIILPVPLGVGENNDT